MPKTRPPYSPEFRRQMVDLVRGDVFEWRRIMAGYVLAAAPPIVIYAFLMDYYSVGLTAGATKG
jgi:multiple sugar transport system permease protein